MLALVALLVSSFILVLFDSRHPIEIDVVPTLGLIPHKFILGEDIPIASSETPLLARASISTESEQFCTLALKNGPEKRPLLSNRTSLVYPLNGGKGDILIKINSQFTASCAPGGNTLANYGVNKVQVTCLPSGVLEVNGEETTFENLGCRSNLKENVTDPGLACYGQNANISIDFYDQQKKYPLMTFCYDKSTLSTLMSKHVIRGGSIEAAEISNNRPAFKEGQLFPQISASSAYTQTNQRNMLKSLLDSANLAHDYIDARQSFYFARGHMIPDGDLVYASEQNATYYYINVFPQWQSINNGNWKALEMAIRKLASTTGSLLTIYTGRSKILKLKNKVNDPTEIYLARDPRSEKLFIPVPKLTWKIVHDGKRKMGVVIIMINNPHELGITSEDIICQNICDKIKWVTWDTMNVRKGYTYCCAVSDFATKVDFAPQLAGPLKILT